jgi:hypothetical protein
MWCSLLDEMAYISINYKNNKSAPLGKWTCAPTSKLEPFDKAPTKCSGGTDLCGQCVSYVKKVCPTLPATQLWKKGPLVKDAKHVLPGTIIATFNRSGRYEGHAAVFEGKDTGGITVYDQWISGGAPKAVGKRLIRWGGHGVSNDGNGFCIVE